jgi:hypothetical protein
VNIKEAKAIAFGSKPSADLDEYYGAWQWLYDKKIYLNVADADYMDKLICDGHITIDK